MKHTTTQLCIACCLSAGLTFAQDGAKKPGPPEGGAGAPNRMAEFLKRLDTDSDGKVTKDEFMAFTKKEGEDRFSKIDANGDGSADEAELKSAAEKMRAGAGGGDQQRRDMRGGEGGGFRRPPGAEGGEGQRRPEGGPPGEGRRPEGGRPEGGPPGEGQGRRPEGGPPGEGGPGRGGFGGGMGSMMGGNVEESFKKMDGNNDGSVTKEEYHAFSSQEIDGRFGRMDTNSDGKITLEEIKSATEKLREMMRGRMGGQGGQGGPEGMRRPGGEGGGFRRPGGEGGEGGGFRRPPSQEGGDRPRPEAEGEKKPGGV